MFNLQFILFLIVLITVVSLVSSLFIEATKKIVSEGKLKEIFGSLEIFALIFTVFVSICTYLVFLLFFITSPLSFLDIIKLIVAGLIFVFACGCGSQVGYDKVIKTIKQIIELIKGGTGC